ncbi:MAG: acyl-ACP--UDP-N-acetylglucosamine O-acyltransferase [Pseudomonadota bacterium]
MIHPTAIIAPEATLGQNISIGPYCIVGPHVVIGDNVTLKSHVVVEGHTEIGSGTEIYPFAVLGVAPQDLKYGGEAGRLVIGVNNRIREHVTMHIGTAGGGLLTKVGDNCLFMVGVHIAHDCVIGDHVIMANNATLGGHVVVGDHALIGGLAAVHQFIRIGKFAMVGGMSGVDNDIIPFGRVKGERASLAGLNLIGLERNGFDKTQVREMQKVVETLFAGEGTFDARLDRIANDYKESPRIQEIVDFARTRDRFPICGPASKNGV